MRSRGDLAQLADLIAERLVAHFQEHSGWVSTDVVADHLGVDISYVYEHAAELGARRLGAGPKARLRFRLDVVDQALHAKDGHPSGTPSQEATRTHPGRIASSSRQVTLLPIRGTRRDT